MQRPRQMSNDTRKMLVEAGVKEYPPKHAARVAAAEAKRQRKAAKRVADAKKAFVKKIVISYETGWSKEPSLIDIGGISPPDFPYRGPLRITDGKTSFDYADVLITEEPREFFHGGVEVKLEDCFTLGDTEVVETIDGSR
jgi:hypothetical protein